MCFLCQMRNPFNTFKSKGDLDVSLRSKKARAKAVRACKRAINNRKIKQCRKYVTDQVRCVVFGRVNDLIKMQHLVTKMIGKVVQVLIKLQGCRIKGLVKRWDVLTVDINFFRMQFIVLAVSSLPGEFHDTKQERKVVKRTHLIQVLVMMINWKVWVLVGPTVLKTVVRESVL